MKRNVFLLFIVFCLLHVTTPLHAEEDIVGFGKTNWGMKQSTIAKLNDIDDWEDGAPPRCFLKDQFIIQGHEFLVGFWFDKRSPSGKLVKVALASETNEAMDSSVYESVLRLLVEKYGKPNSKVAPIGSLIKEWSKTSGQLEFKMNSTGSYGNMKVICNITYLSAKLEKDKL
jgi:hypothetical protein